MRISDWSSDVCSSDLTSRLRTAAEGAALCTRCQGHFIGIDDAVAVLVGPATHGGGALADGSAVIADRHAAFTDRRGAEAQRRGTVCRAPRPLPQSAGLDRKSVVEGKRGSVRV